MDSGRLRGQCFTCRVSSPETGDRVDPSRLGGDEVGHVYPRVLVLLDEGVLQQLGGGHPLLGVLLQAAGQEVAQLRGGGLGVEPRRGFLHNVVQQIPEPKGLGVAGGARGRVGEAPHGGLHQAEAQGPDVRVPAVTLASDALRRHVGDSAHPADALGHAVGQLSADAEVGDLHVALPVDKQVGGLDVPVDDPHLAVQVREAAEDLPGDVREVALLDALAVVVADVCERATVHVLHDGGDGAVLKKALVIAHHIGVVGGVQHPQLLSDLLPQLVRLHVKLYDLEHQQLPRRLVLHLAHHAAAAAAHHALLLQVIQ
mmetsp:Transcript_8064/g.23105  ORF Transcript_8064/g.23105 Transcript_8064/m.23105 type:complete len:314 (+) Transcript_8064:32-973(+)